MDPIRILVVCTANVCRSPMAVGLFQRRLDALGVEASVTSAGVAAVRLPVDQVAVRVMLGRGIDIAAHRPRAVTKEIITEDGADLVITMTRAHLRSVATADRSSFPHTFTLRELNRRSAAGRRAVPTTSFAEWTASLSNGRRSIDLLGDSPDDDIADPYGLGAARTSLVADEMDELIRGIVDNAPWSGPTL